MQMTTQIMADYEEANELGSRYYYSYKGWGLAPNKYIHIHTHVMRQFGPHQKKINREVEL
jgi:hypothetical protein